MTAGDFFGSVGTGAVQSGLGILSNAINAEINSGYARNMANYNYELNEKAANNADRRRRALYNDLESPAAKMRLLKEAGLSPSLYAGGELGGGIGSTAGAQGQGASGGSIPGYMGESPNLAAIQVAQAQARLMNTQADKIEGKNAEGEANVANLWAQAGYYEASAALKRTEIAEKKLDVALKQETFDANVKHSYALAERALWDSKTAFYESIVANNEMEISQETKEAKIQEAIAKVEKIKAETLVNKSLAKLNDAQKQKIYAEIDKWQAEIAISIKDVAIKAYDAQTRREYNKIMDDYYDGQVKILRERTNLEHNKLLFAIVDAVISKYQNQLSLVHDTFK